MTSVKLISHTVGCGELEGLEADDLIAFTARVSNPANQMNTETAPRLLKYLKTHAHWSPFEMSSACIEITTSRGIAAQILRHRSCSFQEFSQRYAEAMDVIYYPARRQDQKNRQNSVDDMSEEDKQWFLDAQKKVWEFSFGLYKEALQKGIAKEQSRFLLPLNTQTKLYMSGNFRSWAHYIELRSSPSTQLEHREIAIGCKNIFIEHFPDFAKAMEWC